MLTELNEAMLAGSTRPTRDAVWNTLTRIIEGWALGNVLPLTVTKVRAIGATLSAGGGGYKSHNNYLSRARTEAERANAI